MIYILKNLLEPGSNTIEDPDVEAEEEDLICDAVEQTEEKDLTSFKGTYIFNKDNFVHTKANLFWEAMFLVIIFTYLR